jgi:diguanylate cyclase (GGDEF)-like protein/PAS domain S-box-containing protein
MRLRLRASRERPQPAVPAEIYIPIVDSLYSETRTLFLGSLAVSLAVLLTAWKTGEILIYLCWVALVLVASARAIDMATYVRSRPSLISVEVAARWEFRYVVGAAGFMGMLGVWCVVVFATTDDPFVQLVSIASTIAYMIGISGRNFGSARLVALLILVDGVPITIALLLRFDVYYSIFAFLLVAFFVSFKFISDRLRNTLLDAVGSARDVALLAERFDTALNNMPHGLAMFDSEQRIVVANNRLSQLFGVRADKTGRKGETSRELVLDCVEAGTILRADADRFADQLENRLTGADLGSFTVQRQDGRTLQLTFQPMDNGGSVAVIEDITERRAAEARISYLARYDALTGLPNRAFFRERMDEALTSATDESAILFVDLDQFKQVNDTLGHPRGDLLLRAVADRLRQVVDDGDIVARFGGDEFVVLRTPCKRSREAADLARDIVGALGETYEVDGHQVVIGATIGIALWPRDAAGADHLLKNADMALYWAKADERGSWRYFEPEMDVRAQARRSIELDLHNALAQNAFEVFYQPLYDLKTRRISTCEALLRWPHAQRGMISPTEFIPVAEEMGLVVPIGRWVLHQACNACSQWPGDVKVAVNLSASQFRRGDVVRTIKDALAESGLDPGRLEIEIMESVLLQDTKAARATLRRLHELGVRICLDDFGTGYSSLSYLLTLPLNKVKIDRSFLVGLKDQSRSMVLLRGVAQLSAELGMSVTVEGIETEEQLALVAAEKNISEVQGYLFSPAIPRSEIQTFLNTAGAGLEKVA